MRNSDWPFAAAIIAVTLMVLMVTLGQAYDRHRTSLETIAKIEAGTQ